MADVAAHLAVQEKTERTDQMMRSILMHANPLWRDQRSTNAKALVRRRVR